ncbi:MAG: hypothetical protein EVA89_18475 [Sandaracinaceae bacterium]|nr:MAG: hypothetical protein EVA89_18475 [Sandaracinaceae bacterium]
MKRVTVPLCALLSVACGVTSSPLADAGPADLDCGELLVAEEDSVCAPEGLVCLEPRGVLCPQREARCADGRVRQDDVWARDGGAPSCPESASTVTASPTGVALEVVASLESGFTTSLALVFVPGHFEACRHPRLMVSFSPRGGLSYEETFPVEAELDLGDATVPMVGEVVISEHDQELARFTGTVSMAGAGYTVEGAFEVTACPDLHRHSI